MLSAQVDGAAASAFSISLAKMRFRPGHRHVSGAFHSASIVIWAQRRSTARMQPPKDDARRNTPTRQAHFMSSPPLLLYAKPVIIIAPEPLSMPQTAASMMISNFTAGSRPRFITMLIMLIDIYEVWLTTIDAAMLQGMRAAASHIVSSHVIPFPGPAN